MSIMTSRSRRVALVTGGAGAIAAASARRLANRGVAVSIVDRDGSRVRNLVDSIVTDGGVAHGVVADLTLDGAVAVAHRETVDVLGDVDILVNALGDHLGASGEFEESSESRWDDLYRVNLRHVMQACRAVVPAMRTRGWGRIVNFSSVEGIRAMPTAPVYAAFNGAVDSFTTSLAVAVARHGICVNSIAVDKTRSYQTNFYRHLDDRAGETVGWIPAGRLGEPDDIAPIVDFLASDGAAWIVGHTIAADGGTIAAGGWHFAPSGWTNTPLVAASPSEATR